MYSIYPSSSSYPIERNFRAHQQYGKLTDAVTEPISVAEAKTQMVIDASFTGDDTLIETYIKAARLSAEAYTGISFIDTTWVEKLDCFPYGNTPIQLSVGKVSSITAIEYIDNDGTLTTWDAANYKLLNTGSRGRIAAAYNVSYPATRDELEAVSISYVSGFGANASDVPQDIKQALLLIVAEMYDQRTDRVRQFPMASQIILNQYSVLEKV